MKAAQRCGGAFLGLAATLLAAVAMPAATLTPAQARQDLEIVDCLLPGSVRIVGGRTYLSSRRPVSTTVSDCRIRGGEYTAYDRANLDTSL